MERTDYESAGFAGGDSAERRIASYLHDELQMPVAEADSRARHLMRLAAPGRGPIGQLLGSVTSHWWLFALRGVLAIIFGILALVQPLAALAALVLVFGVWAFIDGINALALSISGWRSWQLVLGGLVGIAVGLLTFFRPGITAIALYAMVAAWSIARGILEIVAAIELRKVIEGELWLVLAGIASIVFGVLMIILPVAGVLALAWLIGVYALVYGCMQLALGFRLHRVLRKIEPRPHAPTLHPTVPQPT